MTHNDRLARRDHGGGQACNDTADPSVGVGTWDQVDSRDISASAEMR